MPVIEQHHITTGRDDTGADVFGFLVKRSYAVSDGGCEPVATPPILATDEYWEDPETSSLRHEAETMAFKPSTDVVVLGQAHAPGGVGEHCRIGIEIGTMRKLIAVFGDRVAHYTRQGPVFGSPRPFSTFPITFERAYGGPEYPRNPVGVGFVTGDPPETVVLPNFEDPEDLLAPERLTLRNHKYWNRQPLPQGLGWFAKSWYPRMSHVGVVPGNVDADEVMREEALGLVPQGQIALGRQFRLPSWDARFANGAAPGLAVAGLRGDETVRLLNLTPNGRLVFRLPGGRPDIVADIGAGTVRPAARLHNVTIEPETSRVTLIWGACLAYPGPAWLAHMKRLAFHVE